MVAFTIREKSRLATLTSQMSQLLSTLLNLQVIVASNDIKVSTYNTLALMKVEPNYNNIKLWILLGSVSAGDGLLSGQYYYDAASVATANDSSIIQLTSTSTGRLIKFI